MSPSFGDISPTPTAPEVWTLGTWTTQYMDVSLYNNIYGILYNSWDVLMWREDNTDGSDESERYVRVEVQDTSGNVLIAETRGVDAGNGYRAVDLTTFNQAVHAPSQAVSQDIYIVFKLYLLSGTSPIISDISVSGILATD